MIATLKGINGGTVVVNVDNLIYVDAMNSEHGPILGQSVCFMMGGVAVSVKGTPEEVYGSLRRSERINSSLEVTQ